MGITGVLTSAYSWRGKSEGDTSGAQIDMLIDRADNIINLCEMKFSLREYVLTTKDISSINNKIASFVEANKVKKAVHVTMVTTYGLEHNEHWGDIQSEVTLEDLFETE